MDRKLYILEVSLSDKEFFSPSDVVLTRTYMELENFESAKRLFIGIRDSFISLGMHSIVQSTVISVL